MIPISARGNEALQWLDIEPKTLPEEVNARTLPVASRTAKRLFDIVFALFALMCSLPLYPFIMLAIWLEDGRPFFFSHRRETIGGREFGCIKFRSMRKDAETIKAADQEAESGRWPAVLHRKRSAPHARSARWLRKYNLDELPQFWNVLMGDMSIVGPRPSPFTENQYCPPWREARLSVRPGITGLWQIRRTRRQGNDFQEWIRYDLEYVEKASWRLDLIILFKTVTTMIRKGTRQ